MGDHICIQQLVFLAARSCRTFCLLVCPIATLEAASLALNLSTPWEKQIFLPIFVF